MSQADARAWWADVEHLRERIERRRELEHTGGEEEGRARRAATGRARRSPGPVSHDGAVTTRRTVRIRGQAIPTVTAPRLQVVDDEEHEVLQGAWDAAQPAPPPAASSRRRRPSPRPMERFGEQPDRMAMWAVVLGIVMVLAALLSAHGL